LYVPDDYDYLQHIKDIVRTTTDTKVLITAGTETSFDGHLTHGIEKVSSDGSTPSYSTPTLGAEAQKEERKDGDSTQASG